jgi:hypothetical protein
MRDAPSRRRLLAVAGIVLGAATAGCAGVDQPTETTSRTTTSGSDSPSTARPPDREVTGSGTYANTNAGPRDYPERPDDASQASAVEFVRAFEETRTYNGLHETEATKIDVSVRTAHGREAHGGHYVLADAGGWANYENSTADWGVTRVLYFASPDLVVRTNHHEYRSADCKRAFASDDPTENAATPCEGLPATFRAYNCHHEDHTLTIDLDYLGDGTATDVERYEYDHEITDAVRQTTTAYRAGVYRITAALDTGARDSADWRFDEPPTRSDPPLCVAVEPTGDVAIRRVPFHDL